MRALDPLFDEIVKRSGTDLHVSPGHPPFARLGGELVALDDAPLDGKELELMLAELLSASQRARLTTDLELDFSIAHDDAARFRATYVLKRGGLAATFRVVPTRVPSLAELSCPEVLWRLADRRGGLLVVAGAARSGKSSTVAAIIDHINKTRACHVVTVEDPIEYVHEPLRAQVTQMEVGPHTPSVEVGLGTAARENADVVMTSELRSPAALRAALEVASSGALVVASVLGVSSASVLETFIAAFSQEEQALGRGLLADSLVGVVAQQLVPGTDGKRVAAHEVLVGTPVACSLVRENRTAQLLSVMQTGQAHGMATMDTALERLMSAGKVSPENALDRSVDKESFSKLVSRTHPDGDAPS